LKIAPRRAEIVAGLIVVIAIAFMLGRTISSEPFGYDEADYMYAASKGFIASYLDRPSISVIDFVKMGVQGGLHSGERQNLSEYIRHQDDVSFYRHYLVRQVGGPSELVSRWASLLGLLLTAAVVYLGTIAVAGHDGRFVGFLAVSFLLLSPTNEETARWASPHSLYVASALATLFFLAKLIQTKNLQYSYGALVCLALSFLTIEYAPLLLVVLLATLLVHRRELFCAWSRAQLIRFSMKCVLILLLTIGALWPAGFYKLTLVKSYLWYAYYSTVASVEYGAESLTRVWFIRLVSSPVEYLLFAVSCLLLYLLLRRRKHLELLPFALYSILMFLTTVRNRSLAPTYMSSLIPALDVISAFAIWSLLEAHRRTRGAVAALIVSALAISNFFFYYRILGNRPPASNAREAILSRVIFYPDVSRPAILSILRENGLQRERLLVPQEYLSTIHYYFSRADLVGYRSPAEKNEQSNMQVIERLVTDKVDGLVYEGADYATFGNLLASKWPVRSSVALEAGMPGKAVAYYRLSAAETTDRAATVRERSPGTAVTRAAH
jgi:hypothetical protein